MEIGKLSSGLTRFPEQLKVPTQAAEEKLPEQPQEIGATNAGAAPTSTAAQYRGRALQESQTYNARGVIASEEGTSKVEPSGATEARASLEALTAAGQNLLTAQAAAGTQSTGSATLAIVQAESNLKALGPKLLSDEGIVEES